MRGKNRNETVKSCDALETAVRKRSTMDRYAGNSKVGSTIKRRLFWKTRASKTGNKKREKDTILRNQKKQNGKQNRNESSPGEPEQAKWETDNIATLFREPKTARDKCTTKELYFEKQQGIKLIFLKSRNKKSI